MMIACVCGGLEIGVIAGIFAMMTKAVHWWKTR